jgi:hypothetical protein
VCVGGSTTLTDTATGGYWSSTSTAVSITTGTTGLSAFVRGVANGTAVITYTNSSGMATITVTVSPLGPPVTGDTTICLGRTATISNGTPGGLWSSSDSAVAIVWPGGIVTGIATGTILTSYSIPGCTILGQMSVFPAPSPLVVPHTTLCASDTMTIHDTTGHSGFGIWSSSNIAIGSVNTWGMVRGLAPGTTTISYTYSGVCAETATITVSSPMLSSSLIATTCSNSPFSYIPSSASSATTFSWSRAFVSGISNLPATGTGTASETLINTTSIPVPITYHYTFTSGGCTNNQNITVTVNPLPAVTTTSTPASCGNTYTLSSGGAVMYSWSPTTGLSCATCPVTTINPSSTTTYTVTGTSIAGCSNTANITINGDRILGDISFTGSSTDTVKVWLVQYDPSDSSILGMDSMIACNAGPTHYYEFAGKPNGDYMIKAQLLGAMPGTNGYVPTYSLASPYWYSADTVTHSGASNVLNVNMLYGTLSSGPGFVSGYVYLGAGKGTSTAVPGMLVYLEDASGNVQTYTYTDENGAYTFTGLAYGDYTVRAEEYHYYATSSEVITLTSVAPGHHDVNFKQSPASRTITPLMSTGTKSIANNSGLSIFPNPAKSNLNIQWKEQPEGCADLTVSDVVGREVYKSSVNINSVSGKTQIDLNGLKSGVYLISVKSDNINYSGKLSIQQ